MDVSKIKDGLILPQFPGIETPSIDFDDVRDGKRARLFYYDLDLSTARSIATGTATLLQIAGNSFFIDQFAAAGFATAYFQDTNLSAKGAPIYVGPGFITKQPFTQILFENAAQPAKTLRIIYGIDVDFTPGLSAAVSVSNTIAVQGPRALTSGPVLADLPILTRNVGNVVGTNWSDLALMTGAGSRTVFLAAANTNGAIIWTAQIMTGSASAQHSSLLAKATAPANQSDGVAIYSVVCAAGGLISGPFLPQARYIPAGLGLYVYTLALETVGYRIVDYTLL